MAVSPRRLSAERLRQGGALRWVAPAGQQLLRYWTSLLITGASYPHMPHCSLAGWMYFLVGCLFGCGFGQARLMGGMVHYTSSAAA